MAATALGKKPEIVCYNSSFNFISFGYELFESLWVNAIIGIDDPHPVASRVCPSYITRFGGTGILANLFPPDSWISMTGVAQYLSTVRSPPWLTPPFRSAGCFHSPGSQPAFSACKTLPCLIMR